MEVTDSNPANQHLQSIHFGTQRFPRNSEYPKKWEDTTLGDAEALAFARKTEEPNCQKAFKISHVLKYDSVNICRIVFSSNKYRKHKDFLTPTMTNEIL